MNPSRQSDAPNTRRGLRCLTLKNHLRRQILTGGLNPRQKIPSELELCRLHRVSRNTVQRAVLDLVEEGFLTRRQGSGTFVSFRRTREQANLVGVMYPKEPYVQVNAWEGLLAGAQQYANHHGLHVVQMNTQNDPTRSMEAVVQLNEMKAAGTLMIPIPRASDHDLNNESLAALVNSGQSVVLLDTDVEGPYQGKVSCMTSRNFEGTFRATQHLISLGYRRIAFLRGPRRCTTQDRLNGYLAAMRDAGLETPPEYVLKVAEEDVMEQGLQEVDVFLALRNPPQAVVCLHDQIALNVLRRCRERGLRVPQDLAVVGFDDAIHARLADPPLTTIRQDQLKLGYRAMEILHGHLQGTITQPVIEQLPCELIVRESCGAKLPRQTTNPA